MYLRYVLFVCIASQNRLLVAFAFDVHYSDVAKNYFLLHADCFPICQRTLSLALRLAISVVATDLNRVAAFVCQRKRLVSLFFFLS
jgi:hypothetical protein